ncbi:MAG: N-acetylmuramoyl-L-alanine amidase [Sphingomonadales bacterium]|jgi:N-acetylmuramoyl-L-alanine amidase
MIIDHPSPNHDERVSPIDMLLLHHTGMPTGEEALERLCDADAKVSAHYFIEEDGRIFQLVDEARRAWHAGVSCWRGERDVNSRSIGVELVNPGHEWGLRTFPKVQMESLKSLSLDILSRHAIPARHVLGHSDVAPGRKKDPGELFDWEWLASQGVGLWHHKPQTYLPESLIHQSLADFGYNMEDASQVIEAFQRHFRPAKMDGVMDEECCAILSSLMEQIGADA